MASIDFRGGSLTLDMVAGADHSLTFNFTGFTVTGDTLTVEVFNRAGTSVQTYTLSNTDADTAVLSMADIALDVGTYTYALRSAVADAPLCAGEFRVSAISTPRSGSVSSTTITVGSATATVTVELGAAASLSIGTVTTLAEGANATATITGTAPSQVLNFGIPRGASADTRWQPWSPETSPLYLDQYWRFFRGVGFRDGQGSTNTTVASIAAAYQTGIVVASGSGFIAGQTILIAPDTANQQVAVIQSVSGNTITIRNRLQFALSIGTVVRHVWTNDTHPWSAITSGYLWWLSRARISDFSNGMTLFASGSMLSRYTDANGEANVPVGWESFGTAANTSFLNATWAATNDPHARSGDGAYMAAANAGGSGIRTLTAIPVTPGTVVQVSMQAKVWASTPTFSVVDKANTATVLASLVLAGNSLQGADTFSVLSPFVLEFRVPAGVTNIECRITTAAANDIVYFDDLRIVEVDHTPNNGRFVIGDDFLDRPIVWLGDSWGSGTTPDNLGTILATRSGKTVTMVNAAVSGERADQMAARIATDVLPHSPRYCIVQYGANDVVQGRTQAQMEADTDSIISQLRAAGIKPIILGVPPITSVLSTSNDRNDQCRARVDLAVA